MIEWDRCVYCDRDIVDEYDWNIKIKHKSICKNCYLEIQKVKIGCDCFEGVEENDDAYPYDGSPIGFRELI